MARASTGDERVPGGENSVSLEAGSKRSAPGRGEAAGVKGIDTRSVPNDLIARFIGIGSNYYFPDGAAAFKDHGRKLSTLSENREVIKSLVGIAAAREWKEITVSGTERFRKEAWLEGQLLGVGVRGYTPTGFELEHSVRAIARRQKEGGTRDGGPTLTHPSETERAPITGRLIDHDRAQDPRDPKSPMSYYVRVETPRGEREFWHPDLERAINHSLSRASIGDMVSVRFVPEKLARKDVTSQIPSRDHWLIERTDFLAERAMASQTFRNVGVSKKDGVKRYPQLEGSYTNLQLAKALAMHQIPNVADRDKFIGRTRDALADRIERGEPLEPASMHERGAPSRADRTTIAERSFTR